MDFLIKLYKPSLHFSSMVVMRHCSSSKLPIDSGENLAEIYSRKGDHGQTTLENGAVLCKDDKIFSAIGAADELSSQLGFAKEFGRQHSYGDKLRRIQIMLVDVVSAIHNSGSKGKEQIKFSPKNTKELEDWIDEYTKQLTPCEHFILPGGGIASSSLQVARAVCRRTERTMIPLVKEGSVDKEILAYLNRLSDFLFTVSRVACKTDERVEHVYTPSSDVKNLTD